MTTPCVPWSGRTRNGHGIVAVKRNGKWTTTTAHRKVWEDAHGALPREVHVHHRCRNRICVNLEHLEAIGKAAAHHATHMDERTTCRRGHPWVAENTYVAPGGVGRRCRICRQESDKRRVPRRRNG